MQAKFLTRLPSWRGEARAYEVDPMMEYEVLGSRVDEDERHFTKYVIVSAVWVEYTGPETYIFPAHKQGDEIVPINHLELEGSFRGDMDHEQALANAGYEVI